MLVERGLRVMNVGVVGDAYAIASNYLRRTGAIADSLVANAALLGMIVEMFERANSTRSGSRIKQPRSLKPKNWSKP